MQISMRTHLTAGLVAVVGVGAIALSPVGPDDVLAFSTLRPVAPAAATAEVALAGITLPFTDVLALLQTLGLGGAIPDISGLVPADLANAIATEFLNQATPLVTTAATEVFGYLNTTIAGLINGPDSIPARFGAALGEVPGVLLSAFESFRAGDVATTLQVLSSGILAPITAIGQAVIDAGEALQSYVTTQVTAVSNALPAVLLASVSTVITNNLQSVLDAVRTAISDLFGGFFPGAASVPTVPRAFVASVASVASVAPVASVATSTSASSARVTDAAPNAVSAAVESVTPVTAERSTTPVRPRVRPESSNSAARSPASATEPAGTARATTTPRNRALGASRSAQKRIAGFTAGNTVADTAANTAANTAAAGTSEAGSQPPEFGGGPD